MGSAASVVELEKLSTSDIAELVGSLGEAFVPYKALIQSNAITGDLVNSMSEVEMKQMLSEIGITGFTHQKVIINHLQKLKKGDTGGVSEGSEGGSRTKDMDDQLHRHKAGLSDVVVGNCVTMTPRAIMSTLFEIQGIRVDPTDLDPAINKLIKVVGKGFGDGVTTFDCFINYRVASDSDLAEKVYFYLKSEGVHAFLDRRCLKDGEMWKDGFLTGLC